MSFPLTGHDGGCTDHQGRHHAPTVACSAGWGAGREAGRHPASNRARPSLRPRPCVILVRKTGLAKRLKGKKGTVALARYMMEIVCQILVSSDAVYEEKGADSYDQRDHTSLHRRAVEQLERLGYKVILQPSPAA